MNAKVKMDSKLRSQKLSLHEWSAKASLSNAHKVKVGVIQDKEDKNEDSSLQT